ncbi:phage tail protein [Nitrosomonas sp. Is79A3]|uniref:phage tail protein n=1 Tax=Nitrosomonas sp. (strain Is79A3) TaxID=261292 RepID=UPI000A065453
MESTILIVSSMHSLAVVTIYRVFYKFLGLNQSFLKGDSKFWDWFKQIKMNTIKRLPITISLLDETGKATMVWTLTNAWPTKITSTDLKSEGNEVAIESIEIVHEGITISNS